MNILSNRVKQALWSWSHFSKKRPRLQEKNTRDDALLNSTINTNYVTDSSCPNFLQDDDDILEKCMNEWQTYFKENVRVSCPKKCF